MASSCQDTRFWPTARTCSGLRTVTLEDCKTIPNGTEVRVAVIIPDYKQFITRKGDPMAFCTGRRPDHVGRSDHAAQCLCRSPGNSWMRTRPLMIQGKIDIREEQAGPEDAPKSAKILADKVMFLADAVQGSDQPVSLLDRRTKRSRCPPECAQGPAPALPRQHLRQPGHHHQRLGGQPQTRQTAGKSFRAANSGRTWSPGKTATP